MSERIVMTCAERDAANIPVPAIARLMGYATWTEWATMMTKPNPLLMGLKWVEADGYRYVRGSSLPEGT